MQFNKLKTIAAAALSVAMLFSAAACGTSDKAGDSGSDKGGSSKSVTITSYDVSSVKKDDAIAALLPESVTKDGKLTIGTNPSYAPAEFLDADGKTQIGYDMDLARAMGNIFGLDTEIVSSNFDTIIPAIGSKYDLGIAAFTITKERMESVDFVSYFTAGMGYAVAAGNPKNVDENDLCGLNVAVETGTVEEEAINKTAKQCKADGKKDITIQSSKQQTDATTAVVTGKADVFFADSPVVGYAIAQTDGQLEQLGKDFDEVPNAIAIKKGCTKAADAAAALGAIEEAADEILDAGKVPVLLGGEHLVTLGAVRAAAKKYPDLHIVHFDAHADLREDYLGEKLSHASVIRRCWDILGDGRIFQFAIRSGSREEMYWSRGHTTMEKFRADTIEKTVREIAGAPVYVTLDLDAVDPSEFPGTGTPEAGGLRFTELLSALLVLRPLHVAAFDICELSPHYDHSGASTALACKTLREMLLAYCW